MNNKNTTNSPTPPPHIAAAFATFLEYTPPARLNRNLRKMLMGWLLCEQGSAPPYYEDLLADLNNLFELLDVAEKPTP